jgi:hypothetical protein
LYFRLQTEINTWKIISSALFFIITNIKNEHIKEIMGVKGKPDVIGIIEKKILQWYGDVKRMPDEKILKLIMEWISQDRRKRGRPRKTWMEGVQTAIPTRNLEPDQWRNREEWRLVSGRRRQLFNKTDGQIDRQIDK